LIESDTSILPFTDEEHILKIKYISETPTINISIVIINNFMLGVLTIGNSGIVISSIMRAKRLLPACRIIADNTERVAYAKRHATVPKKNWYTV
jgi:hypothetical protein